MKRYITYTFVLHVICALILSFFVLSLSPFGPSSVLATDTSFEPIERGVGLMEENRYDEAIELFSSVIADDFIMNDFALLWRAESYFRKGTYKDAVSDIEIVKTRYRRTAAYKGALTLEIDITEEDGSDEKKLLELYQHFIARFPKENEMRYDYAQALAENGQSEEAGAIFRALYIEAGEMSVEASVEFDVSSLTLDELLSRGNNLLKQWQFRKAETAFQKALVIAPADTADEIQEKIAYCAFRLKDYERSARLYAELNDTYMEAVSYLRTGRRTALLQALDRLKWMKDPRTGRLIIAVANEKRRNGSHDDAIAALTEASADSPFREEMLWQIAWTQYSGGKYTEAEKLFDTLFEQYGSNRYLYWKLRSGEKSSSDVSGGFNGLCDQNDYYGFLACIRYGSDFKKIRATNGNGDGDSPLLTRFGILKRLGFKEEALFELKRLIRTLRKPSEIILYSTKLKEIGEYKKAISIATMVPYGDTVHELWYPIAYWDVINEASSRFSVDPVYILSIAREESRLDPEARSIAGATGLMQLMPDTARRMCRKIKCSMEKQDPLFDVETNILLGSYYLKTLLKRFKSIPLATAAYNAGENVVQRWLTTYDTREPDEFIEEIPYPETRRYVKKVMTTMFQYSRSLGRPHLYKTLQKNVATTINVSHLNESNGQ